MKIEMMIFSANIRIWKSTCPSVVWMRARFVHPFAYRNQPVHSLCGCVLALSVFSFRPSILVHVKLPFHLLVRHVLEKVMDSTQNYPSQEHGYLVGHDFRGICIPAQKAHSIEGYPSGQRTWIDAIVGSLITPALL